MTAGICQKTNSCNANMLLRFFYQDSYRLPSAQVSGYQEIIAQHSSREPKIAKNPMQSL